MNYRVYCDGLLLYHSKLSNLKIFNPSVELELNKTGSFEFSVYPEHPYYGLIKKLKSIITIWQDDYRLFRGRVLDEEVGFHNQRMIVCEGDLSFLLDSVLRPFTLTGTPAEVLAYILELHNAQVEPEKRFSLGTVTVEGGVNIDLTEHTTTLDVIQEYFLDSLGGYLMTREDGGVYYLDYLQEITLLAPQKIEFGKNLIDLKRIKKGGDTATVIIPLGAKMKDEEGNEIGRLTIESVNGGVDFLQDEAAIHEHGTIVKKVIFEDITDAAALKLAGEAQLADSVNQWETIELSAADMATLGQDIASFHIGTQVQVTTKPHGIDHRFVVSKLSIKLLDAAANRLTLGKTVSALTKAVGGISGEQSMILRTVEKAEKSASEAVYNVERNVQASIQVAAENIQSTVAENYYLKEDTDALISSVSTVVEQTKESVEIQFTQFSKDIEAVAAGVDAEFEERKKYIRFEDGNIIQGAEGSPFYKVQSATKESYFDNGAEVAYFSNRKLYVTDGEYTHSLRIGKLEITPRANGNTSINIV